MMTHTVGLKFSVAAVSMSHAVSGPCKAMNNPVIDWMIARGRMRFCYEQGSTLFIREDCLRPLIRETRPSGEGAIYD